ncbi:hypothetical protein JGH00_22225 [Salmonella enterica subsp. enterica serovar London]|nr:hypothetical protein [Salmonella enterica subsp. enterica serovar London]
MLERAIPDILKRYNLWRVKINASKTKAMMFDPKNRELKVEPPKHNNQTIELKDHHDYLGVTLGRKLNFNKHVTNRITKVKRTKGRLMTLLHRNSGLSKLNKAMICPRILFPILMYAWASISNSAIELHWCSKLREFACFVEFHEKY